MFKNKEKLEKEIIVLSQKVSQLWLAQGRLDYKQAVAKRQMEGQIEPLLTKIAKLQKHLEKFFIKETLEKEKANKKANEKGK